MSKMNILCNAEVVAELIVKDDEFNLIYTDEWSKKGFALSPSLPLNTKLESQAVKNFILNLLPEGEGLEALSLHFQISKANPFGLLNAIGKETSGALSFGMVDKIETSFREISRAELTQRIQKRRAIPITIWDGKPRLSLAGVQEKLPVTIIDGKFGFGEGDVSSTHILKFDKGEENLVLNEYISLKLAQKAGLHVNEAKIDFFGEEPVLVVERFDRKLLEDGTIQRLHLIDSCQLLSFPPQFKYERIYGSGRDVKDFRYGVSFKKLVKIENMLDTPLLYRQSLLDWSILNLCLGNSDAHGKNISFFVKKGSVQLAPFYDVLNISLYDTYEHSLAMGIGDEFEIESIKAFDIALHTHHLNIKPKRFRDNFHRISNAILKEADAIGRGSEIQAINQNFCDHYMQNITTRIKNLKECIQEAQGINVVDYI